MTPTIIFEFDGKKREIPLFLKSINVCGEFNQDATIEIQAISSDKSDLENWGRLTAHLYAYSGGK